MLLLSNKDVSVLMTRKLHASYVNSYVRHGSETWPAKKENELTLQRAEMRMIRWMCGIKITDKFSSSELRERLGICYIITVIQ